MIPTAIRFLRSALVVLRHLLLGAGALLTPLGWLIDDLADDLWHRSLFDESAEWASIDEAQLGPF